MHNLLRMESLLRLAASLTVAVVVIALYMSRVAQFQRKSLPRGFRSPVLAIQLVHSRADIAAIVGDQGDPDRRQMRRQQQLDHLLITAYWAAFVVMSVVLVQRSFPGAQYLGILAGLCATGAALSDVQENQAVLRVLAVPLVQTDESMVDVIRQAATRKWLLLFVAMALLSLVCIGRRDWATAYGTLCLLSGLSFLLAAIIGLVGLWQNALLEYCVVPMGLGLLTLAFALGMFPAKFVEGL